jgi:hypothetical protein
VGKAERQTWVPKGYGRLQEDHRSQAYECSYAEEVVGDDEGALGSEAEVESIVQDLNAAGRRRFTLGVHSCLSWYIPLHNPLHTERVISNVFLVLRKTREWRDK